MGVTQRFHDLMSNRHQYAREWKEKRGGKVVGYLCGYVPEEVLYAAGILPVRILGSHEPQDLTEAHIFNMYCPFCRDCLAQGLQGRYEYLDGITTGHSCMHMRQTFDSWVKHLPVSYNHYLYVPAHVQSVHAQSLLREELGYFKQSVEEWTGKPISNEALDRAIDVYNTNRRLLKQVYELRKSDPPSISGVEAMEIVLTSMFVDKEEHNQLLRQALAELPQQGSGPGSQIRLMFVGSANDDIEFTRMTEELGSYVVIEDHCTGSRYFWSEVVPQDDRLTAIAASYINKPACPQKDLVERTRFPYLLGLARDYNVQAAVVIQQKFCDPHEFDIPPIRALLEGNGIPVLFLEFDLTVPLGQFRTRVEAFFEMLQTV
ncbi:MAG: 2-hydroxyacyl-CoA dehydratase [Candidatus Tectomicrobia bacterium]|uniref:2-hydroxyacyl-CoA dehydratase n=1 Tax=Tectimicrobiota bacterium TaxID=2528274 RepID=A0A932CPB7_UNCTE|nr:2-hydroxyacyl-CoA dehydratase [Candidatus Tectomicrobia bacterium]